MKKHIRKGFTLLLAVLFTLPILAFSNPVIVHAKEKEWYYPTISCETKVLDESGDTYKISLKNKWASNIEHIKWYSLNDKIATVAASSNSYEATVTAVRKGTTQIKCELKLKEGSTYKLSCKVKVKNTREKYNDKNDKNNKPDEKNKDNNDFEPQAELLSLERTGYYNLTATFDREIQTPGLVLVNDRTECIEGIVNPMNRKEVNYTISDNATTLMGWHKVAIGYWEGYHVSSEDNSSDYLRDHDVNFSMYSFLPLPEPTSVYQSKDDNNIVYIQFPNTVDESTAKIAANYAIDGGVNIESVQVTNNDKGGLITLKIKEGTIMNSRRYLITVKGIKGYNESFTEMEKYEIIINLKENTIPTLIRAKYTYPQIIVLEFNETITGTPAFQVVQDSQSFEHTTVIIGNTLFIYLAKTPTLNTELLITPNKNCKIVDYAGNSTTSVLTRRIMATVE